MIQYDILKRYAKERLNVLLIGPHGVGKTTVTTRIFTELGLKYKYYSAGTMDPWADLVGIPIPVDDAPPGALLEKANLELAHISKKLVFVRPKDIDEAQAIFFDEMNRAHPKVTNAIFEIIQFRSINGVPLPNLELCWAAVNPPTSDYHVTELDQALADRFQIHMELPNKPDKEYLGKACGDQKIANIVVNWWSELKDEYQKIISPRRCEYICKILTTDMPLDHVLPYRIADKINLRKLEEIVRIGGLVTIENLKTDPAFRTKVTDRVRMGDLDAARAVYDVLKKEQAMTLVIMISLVEALPVDMQNQLFASNVSGDSLKKFVDMNYRDQNKWGSIKKDEVKRLLALYKRYLDNQKQDLNIAPGGGATTTRVQANLNPAILNPAIASPASTQQSDPDEAPALKF